MSDVLQLFVHVADAGLSILRGLPHVLQFRPHPQQFRLARVARLLHPLELYARFFYAFILQRFQRLLSVPDHVLLFPDLLFQQLALRLQVVLRVPVQLQLLLVQFQLLAQVFDGGLGFFHSGFELGYAGYPHFYVYARCRHAVIPPS